MREITTIVVVALAALGAMPTSTPGTEADSAIENTIAYDVAAVKRQLLLATEDGEVQLQQGDQAHSGDSLRTASRSNAVPSLRATSEIALYGQSL